MMKPDPANLIHPFPEKEAEGDQTEAGQIRISEIYESRQGEGLLTGTTSVFIRTSGCNLRCWFCDTRFASWEPEGEYRTIDSIVQECQRWAAKHIVLTGGEPLIFSKVAELTQRLHALGYHITIETAGTIHLDVACDLISLSPKLSGSNPSDASPAWQLAHEKRRERLDVVGRFICDHDYQLKFVVDHPGEAEELVNYIQRLEDHLGSRLDRSRLLVMPQGVEQGHLEQQAEWLLPWCEQHHLQFCPRAHIQWFGNTRGT
ncbi:MAG: 7-carboxy-7-deazaguanine synthase QueE [Planctomycetota bacterium]